MSYTVNVTERLPRLSISRDYSSPSVQFEINDILDETVATGYGIAVGDTLTGLNDESFHSVVSQSKFKDPTCILWDTKLPFTLTLMRKHDVAFSADTFVNNKKDKKKMFKTPHPRCNTGNTEISKIDLVGRRETYSMAVERVESNLLETDSAEISEVGFDSIDSEISESDIPLGAESDSEFEMESNEHSKEPSGTLSIYKLLCEYKQLQGPLPSSHILSAQLIDHHLVQRKKLLNNANALESSVHFDSAAITQSNGKIIALSSRPLTSGKHEWSLEILKCDVLAQEIGVCSVRNIEEIQIHDDGVTETAKLSTRAVYGSNLQSDAVWYASFNENGTARCYRNLNGNHHIGWTAKCKIKVVVDLDKWRITFYLNGHKVRFHFCGDGSLSQMEHLNPRTNIKVMIKLLFESAILSIYSGSKGTEFAVETCIFPLRVLRRELPVRSVLSSLYITKLKTISTRMLQLSARYWELFNII